MSKITAQGASKRELLENEANKQKNNSTYLEEGHQLTNGKTQTVLTPGMVDHLKKVIVDKGSLKELENTPNGHLQEYFDKVGNELSLESFGIAEFKVPLSQEEKMEQYQPVEDLKVDHKALNEADKILQNAGNLNEATLENWQDGQSTSHSAKSKLG